MRVSFGRFGGVLAGAALAAAAAGAGWGAMALLGPSASLRPRGTESLRLGPLPDAALVDQAGRTTRLSDLAGSPWIAGFVFTRCEGPCPRLTAEMARLSHALADTPLRFLLFTVDPDHDTPEVLARYASHFRLGERTRLLTGPRAVLYALIRDGFKLGVAPAEEAEAESHFITHSQRLVLVDRSGFIRGYYDGLDPEATARLAEAARALAREE